MNITKIFEEFFNSEKASGIVLIICTAVSLLLANSFWDEVYLSIWKTNLFNLDLTHWINDGLMAIFFLMVGLELERELYIGELSKIKDATLPIFAAIGGMIIPLSFYLVFNYNTPTQSGFGIPMATDIAFALGILSLIGKNVPTSIKVFLTALAVIDDLGAIIIIAIFYTANLSFLNLAIALFIFIILFAANRAKVQNLIFYLIGGIFLWIFMLKSGVHATMAGVLLAFVIPFGDGSENSLSYKVQHFLHKPVAFSVLPLFALANTAIQLTDNFTESFFENYSIGIAIGLIFGKPLGIFLMSMLSVGFNNKKLPEGFTIKAIIGTGFLAGIGFTMSIFISLLAFNDNQIIDNSKLVILISSLIAGTIGFSILKKNYSQQ